MATRFSLLIHCLKGNEVADAARLDITQVTATILALQFLVHVYVHVDGDESDSDPLADLDNEDEDKLDTNKVVMKS